MSVLIYSYDFCTRTMQEQHWFKFTTASHLDVQRGNILLAI
jgi:hypothetical protein